MSESKYREWILDTIDSLRSRKARPDLERICRMVRRRHGSEPDRTCVELEKLIQEQTVLKVNYKGSISYRNAAKVQRRSRKKDDVSLATAARRSAMEEASHSDLSNGDSAFGAVDQDEEDLEVMQTRCRGGSHGWRVHISLSCHITQNVQVEVKTVIVQLGGEKNGGKAPLFVSRRGVVRGVICKCTQKVPQTGSGGWSSLERCRGGEEKKVRVWLVRACHISCCAGC